MAPETETAENAAAPAAKDAASITKENFAELLE